MEKRKSIRAKYIDQLEEVIDALELCEEYDVIHDGLETLDEIKDRLRLQYNLVKHGNEKRKIENAMFRISEEDDKKRERLTHMYEELISILDCKDESKRAEFVTDLLQKDHTSEDLLDDCDTKIEHLQKKECMILIAGETSAGKSSFLNLLFGYEILPTHTVSCTSTITTLRYGAKSHARILFGSAEKETIVIEPLDESGRQELYKTVFMRGNERHEGHDVKEVQVFLPLDILKSGLVLADTPGIGENEFLEEYLMEFIQNNEILAFVYLIFSDSAGGVKEDRLLLLLKLIIEQQNKSNSGIPFDPKCAMFVANRFDAVPEESREKVKDHILKQLGKFWPQFDESMTVFFSTKRAQSDIDANPEYVNNDYKAVLEALSNLFSKAIDRRIRSSYKWMEKVLQRICHYLKTTVKRLGCTQREYLERSDCQRRNLRNLQEKSDIVVRESRADIEIRSRQIFSDINSYLSTPQAKFLLCSAWKDNEIPEISCDVKDQQHWLWIQQRVDAAFYNRLCTAIEEWEDEKNKVSEVEAEIVEIIKLKLGILQEDVNEVENDLSNSNNSKSSGRGELRRGSIRIAGILFMDIPLQLSPSLQQHVSSNPIRKIHEVRQATAFHKDPKAWSKHRAEKLIKKLIKNEKDKVTGKGMMTMLVDQLMRRPKDIIDTLELKIPSIIDANLQLLSTLEDQIVNGNRHTAQYEHMMVQVEGLKKSLMDYGEGYIFVNDFKSNEIKILQDHVVSSRSLATTFRFSELLTGRYSTQPQASKTVPKGLWTITQNGILDREGDEKNISIKMYMPSAGVSHTFQEVAKLRCLLHTDVPLAQFLGIHHTDATAPAYIFEGNLQSLYTYWNRCTNQSKHLIRILLEVVQGLSYIHTKGMVHMELTSSTVTVAENGEVQMTGACIPRHATFPLDKETKVEDFVYLAPEVLKNDLYISSSDVYGFGLLMYEMASGQPAFEQRRSDSLKEFTEKVQHEVMPQLDHVQAECMRDLIRQCIATSEGNRPSSHSIVAILKEMKDSNVQMESLARNNLPRTYTPGHVFRRSREYERNSH